MLMRTMRVTSRASSASDKMARKDSSSRLKNIGVPMISVSILHTSLSLLILHSIVSCMGGGTFLCNAEDGQLVNKAKQSTNQTYDIIINEILASNDKNIRDEYGKYTDWIELQVKSIKCKPSIEHKEFASARVGNCDATPLREGDVINLSGWSLTDDPEHKELWTFPEHDIAVNEDGYLLVFAGGNKSNNASSEPELAAQLTLPLHANFKLSSKGDYLALIDPTGAVKDKMVPNYPTQYSDISWGRPGNSVATLGYLQEPTPGRPNTASYSKAIIKMVNKTFDPMPTTQDDLDIRVCIAIPGMNEELFKSRRNEIKVKLMYRLNYQRENSMEMQAISNSTVCDIDRGFQEFRGIIQKMAFSGPAGARNGDIVRWYVTLRYKYAFVRSPSLDTLKESDKGNLPEYYGTAIVEKNSLMNRNVELFHMIIPDNDAFEIERKSGVEARCSIYFQGHFYDNVKIRQRGITALMWPKKKFKLDFKGSVFKIKFPNIDQIKVEEFNLQSHWEEPGEESYMRENIASDFFHDNGLPVSSALHVEIIQNGKFYGLYSIIEQMDEDFLKRINYNPKGHLYKAFSGTASNLNDRVPERLLKKVYRRGNNVTNDGDWSDLHSLTQSLAGKNPSFSSVEQYLYTHMNLPELINELALQAAILNQDRCTKNYYVYYDTDQEEWSRFPWDLEAVMGLSNALGGVPAEDYCMLICPQFNSPLYCDSDHPQVGYISLSALTGNY